MHYELTPITAEILSKIYEFNGKKVMLDADLAHLYGVTTKQLNQAVKRNKDRFPDDFICLVERQNLRSQIVTSSLKQYGGRRYATILFTEQGIAMLSSVLRSERAVKVNIEIMRAFVRAREFLLSQQELHYKLEDLEKRFDENFKIVFDALREVITVKEKTNEIGFKTDEIK